jgi:hypothetical protein
MNLREKGFAVFGRFGNAERIGQVFLSKRCGQRPGVEEDSVVQMGSVHGNVLCINIRIGERPFIIKTDRLKS